MTCTKCGSNDTGVARTIVKRFGLNEVVTRYRHCSKCGGNWKTEERSVSSVSVQVAVTRRVKD